MAVNIIDSIGVCVCGGYGLGGLGALGVLDVLLLLLGL